MEALDRARLNVAMALGLNSSPAVLSSFGKDSMLLLWLVRDVRPDTPVIWFRTGLDESFGRRMVREWNLTVFRWEPAEVYLLRSGLQRTLVTEYSIGADRLPLLTDLDGHRGPCAAKKFADRTPALFLPFDTLLVGWKDSDTHWVKGDAPLAKDGFMLGSAQVIAPLRHMTDSAVRSAIVDHEIPFEPAPDELALCTECIATMPLPLFRSRFNLTTEVLTNGPSLC